VRKQKKKAEQEKQQKLQAIQQSQQQQQQQSLQPNGNILNQQQQFQQTQLQHQPRPNIVDNQVTPDTVNPLNPNMMSHNKLPCLVELSYEGFDIQSPRVIQIKSDFYEIGNDKLLAATHPMNYIRIDPNIPGIEKKHCALKKSQDNMQILLVPYAETYVNDRMIKEPVQLMNTYTIRLGKFCVFRLENPNEVGLSKSGNSASNLNNPQQMGNNNMKPQMNIQQQQQQQQQQIIPPNYGVLYDSGQVAADQQPQASSPMLAQPQAIPQTSQQPVQQSIIRNTSQQPILNNQTQPQPQQQPTSQGSLKHNEPGLPGLLEFPEDGEDQLLATICSTNQTQWQFKLAPVYTMYMMLRFRLSQKYKSELSFNEKLHNLSLLIHKMVNFKPLILNLNQFINKLTLLGKLHSRSCRHEPPGPWSFALLVGQFVRAALLPQAGRASGTDKLRCARSARRLRSNHLQILGKHNAAAIGHGLGCVLRPIGPRGRLERQL
jgi:hypothetical protein